MQKILDRGFYLRKYKQPAFSVRDGKDRLFRRPETAAPQHYLRPEE